MLSGTYRHLSNVRRREFLDILHSVSMFFSLANSHLTLIQRVINTKSESNFLAPPFGSEADRLPPAGAGGGVLFIIYEFGFLRQNLYRAAQSILETGQTVVCKCCQAGRPAKSIPNIVISNTLRTPQMPIALSNLAFSFTIYNLHAVQCARPDR